MTDSRSADGTSRSRRRLRIPWEICDDIHEAFLTLGCALICWRRLKSLRWEFLLASVSRLKTTPSIPTVAQDSHSRTVSGSVVDGHSAHGAKSRWAPNPDSSAARRREYGHPVVTVPDSLSRSNATKWAAHSSAARSAPAPRRASRFCNRSESRGPAASHTTSSLSIAVASGNRTAPDAGRWPCS